MDFHVNIILMKFNAMNYILETDILVTLPCMDEEVAYDIECYDGYGIGKLSDSENNTLAPSEIRMIYPTLKDVLSNEDEAEYVLKYRGLYDLTIEDIHYGDIMLALGEVVVGI